jgi:hypothetical protein
LPDESVVQLVSVTQGETTYVQGTDFRLLNDRVDWSLPGGEPAPGSTYTVIYHYRLIVQPESPDTKGFTVSNAVEGQLVTVMYSYRLPRVDIITMNREGAVSMVCGVPHRHTPVPPSEPNDTLKLATVTQTWEGLPAVVNDAVRVTSMRDLENIRRSIIDVYDLTARNSMKTDAIIGAPSSARGLFVDPFTNDNMRDHGIAQSAAIVNGELMLPLDAEVMQFVNDAANTLDYTHEVVLEQTARTGQMRINPYQAQDPIPAKVTLNPSVDRWQELNTEWASGITKQIVQYAANYHYAQGSGIGPSLTSTSAVNELLDVQTDDDTTIRPLEVELAADGFGADEAFTVTFDGIQVQSGIADEIGRVVTSFYHPRGYTVGYEARGDTGRGRLQR